MGRSTAAAVDGGRLATRFGAFAERLLRLLGDPRLALALLLLAGAWNAAAAGLPSGARLLDGAPYGVLLAVILASALAAVAVRTPVAWREWRRPSVLSDSPELMTVAITHPSPIGDRERAAAVDALTGAGYRVRQQGSGSRWVAAGVRRGWSRFLGLASHLALVLVVLGAATTAAFATERTFSLLPGDQAFLQEPGPGRTAAVELIAFDPLFGADGRPVRLDVEIALLRDGGEVERRTLRVNEPASFDGLLLHGWTYGPAATLRVTTLGGRPLWDAGLALDGAIGGRPGGFAELPAASATLGVALADPATNELAISLATDAGLQDAATLTPGASARVGQLVVRHEGLASYVTFLARRDPGIPLLFGGGAMLAASLAVAFWLPRRRVTLRSGPDGLRLSLRGERFDRPEAELARLARWVGDALAGRP